MSIDLHAPSVLVTYPRLLLRVVKDRGADASDLLACAQISPDVLETPDGLISASAYALMALRAMSLTGDANLGCEMGLGMPPTMHGNLGLLGLTSTTGIDALNTLSRYFRLASPFLDMFVDRQGPRLMLSFQETGPLDPVRSFVIQSVVIGLYRGGVMLMGQPRQSSDLILHFKGPEPRGFARYIDRLPPLAFEQVRDGLDVALAYVDAPLSMSDALTAKKATTQCEQDFARFTRSAVPLSEQVSYLLKHRSDADSYPTMDALAERLRMSSRTLTRKLDAEGKTFTALVDERRCTDAQWLLSQTDLRINEVAARLGYSDSANFTRAFRKWTGKTPGTFRQETNRQFDGSPVDQHESDTQP